MYNAAMRRVCTTVVVEQQSTRNYECVFVAFGIQQRNAHAPHCHLWPARLYNIFNILKNNRTFDQKKKLLNTKCVF